MSKILTYLYTSIFIFVRRFCKYEHAAGWIESIVNQYHVLFRQAKPGVRVIVTQLCTNRNDGEATSCNAVVIFSMPRTGNFMVQSEVGSKVVLLREASSSSCKENFTVVGEKIWSTGEYE